jgi:hypothetical protein
MREAVRLSGKLLPLTPVVDATVSEAIGFSPLSDWRSTENVRVGMNNIIYIVGLVVVVIAVLSFFGLR